MTEEGVVASMSQRLIDASEDRFKKATQFGQGLITSSHFAAEEVKEKVGELGHPSYGHTQLKRLSSSTMLQGSLSVCICSQLVGLVTEKSELLKLWEERKAEFDQCMELQVWLRDADQADAWMAKQEVTAACDLHMTCM